MAILARWSERRARNRRAADARHSHERRRLADAAAALIACVKALALDIDEIGAPALKAAPRRDLRSHPGRGGHGPARRRSGARRMDVLAFAGRERES